MPKKDKKDDKEEVLTEDNSQKYDKKYVKDIEIENNHKTIFTSSKNVNNEIIDIFRNVLGDKTHLTNFFIAVWLWTMNHTIYYQTLLNLQKFKEYYNEAPTIFFTSCIVSSFVSGVFANYFGRKVIINIGAMFTSISLIFLYYYENDKENYYSYVAFISFNFFFSFTGNFIEMFIPEMFPPNIKNTCVSYAKLPARILLIVLPFIFVEIRSLYLFYFVMNLLIPLILMFTKETKMT